MSTVLTILATAVLTATALVVLFKTEIIPDLVENNYKTLVREVNLIKSKIQGQRDSIEDLKKQINNLQNKTSIRKQTRRKPKTTKKNE